MENKSWLRTNEIYISDGIVLNLPTIGEVLDNEQSYYSLTTNLTMSPFEHMVQLDDMGIDYTKISEWDLFKMTFISYSEQITNLKQIIYDTKKTLDNCINQNEYNKNKIIINNAQKQIDGFGFNLVFKNINMVRFRLYKDENNNEIIFNPYTKVKIDKQIYYKLTDAIRKINLFEHDRSTAGNEHAKQYLLEKKRKELKRNARKDFVSVLEKQIISLVNSPEFKYNYETCMNLSIYNFNQSFKQIKHRITFDNTMIGVYAGTVDTEKLSDKSCLTWISD